MFKFIKNIILGSSENYASTVDKTIEIKELTLEEKIQLILDEERNKNFTIEEQEEKARERINELQLAYKQNKLNKPNKSNMSESRYCKLFKDYIGINYADMWRIIETKQNEQCKKIDTLNKIYKDKIDNYCNNKLIYIDDKNINKIIESSEKSIQLKIEEGSMRYDLDEKNVLKLTNGEKVNILNNYWTMVNEEYNCNSLEELIIKIANLENLIEFYEYIKNYKTILKGISYCENVFEFMKVIELYINREKVIKSATKISNIGEKGEKSINRHLELYNDEIINLPNIILSADGRRAECDNILITRYGVFVLEIKNIGTSGKFSIHIKNDGKWNKVVGDKSEPLEFDATTQNVIHSAIVKKVINRKLNRNIDNLIDVNHFVVIANNILDINNESSQHVLRISGIYDHIRSYEPVFSYEEMKEIENVLLKSQIKENIGYPIVDFKNEVLENAFKIKEIANYLGINDNSMTNVLDIIEEWHEERKKETKKYLDENNYYLDYYKNSGRDSIQRTLGLLYENSRVLYKYYDDRSDYESSKFQYLIEGDRITIKIEGEVTGAIFWDDCFAYARYFVSYDSDGYLQMAVDEIDKRCAMSSKCHGMYRGSSFEDNSILIVNGKNYIGEYKEIQIFSIKREDCGSYRLYARIVD